MHNEIFSEKFGGTTACVMRGIRSTSIFKHHISEKDDDDNEEIEVFQFYVGRTI